MRPAVDSFVSLPTSGAPVSMTQITQGPKKNLGASPGRDAISYTGIHTAQVQQF